MTDYRREGFCPITKTSIQATRPMGEREFTTARLFSGLWALYILIHQLKQIPWGPHYSVALMVLAVVMSGLALRMTQA